MINLVRYCMANGEVLVPCDTNNNPDLSRVPEKYGALLKKMSWKLYKVTTTKDKEIFAEVQANGFSVQKIVVSISEGEVKR